MLIISIEMARWMVKYEYLKLDDYGIEKLDGKRKGVIMRRCSICGCRFGDNFNVCPGCGAVQEYYTYKRNNFDHTAEFSYAEAEADKPFAIAAYLFGFPGILLSAVGQKSKYVGFHNRQALKYTVLSALVDLIGFVFIGLVCFFAGLGMPQQYLVFSGFFGALFERFAYGFERTSGVCGFIIAVMILFWIVLRILCIIDAVKVMRGRSEEGLLVRLLRFL